MICGHLGRNFLKGRHGDKANAVLTAVGHNPHLILNWLRIVCAKILDALYDACRRLAVTITGISAQI